MVSPDRSPVQPTLKTVATVCRFPDLKAVMIRGLPHPERTPAPSRPAQKRDDETHRLVKLQTGSVTDRGPHQGKAAKGGLSARLRGKRLATDNRHRADTDQAAKGLPLCIGGKVRGSAKRYSTRSAYVTYLTRKDGTAMMKQMVPMPAFIWVGGFGGRGSAVALCGTGGLV